jgi:hypothetical protein
MERYVMVNSEFITQVCQKIENIREGRLLIYLLYKSYICKNVDFHETEEEVISLKKLIMDDDIFKEIKKYSGIRSKSRIIEIVNKLNTVFRWGEEEKTFMILNEKGDGSLIFFLRKSFFDQNKKGSYIKLYIDHVKKCRTIKNLNLEMYSQYVHSVSKCNGGKWSRKFTLIEYIEKFGFLDSEHLSEIYSRYEFYNNMENRDNNQKNYKEHLEELKVTFKKIYDNDIRFFKKRGIFLKKKSSYVKIGVGI